MLPGRAKSSQVPKGPQRQAAVDGTMMSNEDSTRA